MKSCCCHHTEKPICQFFSEKILPFLSRHFLARIAAVVYTLLTLIGQTPLFLLKSMGRFALSVITCNQIPIISRHAAIRDFDMALSSLHQMLYHAKNILHPPENFSYVYEPLLEGLKEIFWSSWTDNLPADPEKAAEEWRYSLVNDFDGRATSIGEYCESVVQYISRHLN